MTISFMAGRRIQGLSTDIVQTITLNEDFDGTTDSGWSFNDNSAVSINTTTDKLQIRFPFDNTLNGAVYDLGAGNVSETAWVLRWEITHTTLTDPTGGSNFFQIGFFSENETVDLKGTEDHIVATFSTKETNQFRWNTECSDGGTRTSATEDTTDMQTSTNYYCELIRDGTNLSYTVKTGSYSGTTVVDVPTLTIPSGVTGLRYLGVKNEVESDPTAVLDSDISNITFYNGVSSLTSKPTNVQSGSRFEETDTRKIYYANGTGTSGCKAYYNAEIGTPTLDEDFSSYADQTSADNTWIRTNTSSTKVKANATTDVLDCLNDNTASTTSDSVYYDLGSALSDTAWVCRFTLDLTSFTARTDTNTQFSSFRITSTTGTGDPNQDSMGLNLYTHTSVGNKYEAIAQDNAAWTFHAGGSSSDTLSVETKYVEMIRNGDTITVKFYNNSSYGSVVESFSDTQTGVTGLRYVKAQARRTTSSAHGIISFTVDDIKIYDGVTSVFDTSFINKATTANGFADGLGSSANGTNVGATQTTGKVGSYAWDFTGASDYVTIGDTSTWKFLHDETTPYTISLWVKRSGTQANNEPALLDTQGATASNVGLSLYWQSNGTNLYYFISDGTGTDSKHSSAISVSTTDFDHLVFVQDWTNLKIYKNNSLIETLDMTSFSGSTGNSAYALNIARNPRVNSYANFYLDELAIFSRALTSSEVSTLYNSGTGKNVTSLWAEEV